MNISLYKKIKFFFEYKRIVKEQIIRNLGDNPLNIQVDNIYRIYTVLNIPSEDFYSETPSEQNLRKMLYDGYKLLGTNVTAAEHFRNLPSDKLKDAYIKTYINQAEKYFNQKGLNELVGLLDIKQVDTKAYLIVFGYSLLDIKKIINNSIYTTIAALVFSIIYHFCK